MQVTTVGLDLAKSIFQVHGVSEDGEVAFNQALRRAQLLAFFENLPPCLVGMEACGSSHYWARQLSKLGHEVRLIPAMYVKPYVKRGKSDAVDAAAICEAVTRPTMYYQTGDVYIAERAFCRDQIGRTASCAVSSPRPRSDCPSKNPTEQYAARLIG